MMGRGWQAPDGFLDQPEVEPHLIWLRDAFWELGTERQFGMTVGPIPVSKIREYLRDECELDSIEYDRAKAILSKMDNAYLGMLNRRKDDGPVLSDSAKATDVEGVNRVMSKLGKKRRT